MKIVITEKQYIKLIESNEPNEENILIVGDSHTVDLNFTWSGLMKKNFKNVDIVAIGGKRTSWMKQQLESALEKKHYDKVFIWGGNNDTFSLVKNTSAITNIQQMVDMVNKQDGEAFVIVGYDQRVFSTPGKYTPPKDSQGRTYATKEQMDEMRNKYIEFQDELASSIKNATIIPPFQIDNSYTSDNIHGNAKAHKKVFDLVSPYVSSDFTPEKDEKNTKITTNDDESESIDYSDPDYGKYYKQKKDTKTKTKDTKSTEKEVDYDETTSVPVKKKSKYKYKDDDYDETKSFTPAPLFDGDVPVIEACPRTGPPEPFPSDLESKFKEAVGDDSYNEFISGCERIGWPPLVGMRQLYQESTFKPCQTSFAGAKGFAQFLPGTWAVYGEGDICNIQNSVTAYIKLIEDMMKRFPGRIDLVLAGYNSGPNRTMYSEALKNETPVLELPLPDETYKYVCRILQP